MARQSAGLALALAAASITAILLPRLVFPQAPESGPRDPPRVRPEARLVPQRQWEYMQLPCLPLGEPTGQRREVEERLNEQGKRGWEMVSLLEVEQPPTRGCLLATFKRQLVN